MFKVTAFVVFVVAWEAKYFVVLSILSTHKTPLPLTVHPDLFRLTDVLVWAKVNGICHRYLTSILTSSQAKSRSRHALHVPFCVVSEGAATVFFDENSTLVSISISNSAGKLTSRVATRPKHKIHRVT